MIIGLAYLLVLASVPLARGRLMALADLPLRRPGAGVAAILIQIVVISVIPTRDHTLHTTLHLLPTRCSARSRSPTGGSRACRSSRSAACSNFIAIAANGGVMPDRTRTRSRRSPRQRARGRVRQLARRSTTRSCSSSATSSPRPTSLPLHNVFSIGDGILLLGVFVLVHVACGSRLVPRRFAARPAVAA